MLASLKRLDPMSKKFLSQNEFKIRNPIFAEVWLITFSSGTLRIGTKAAFQSSKRENCMGSSRLASGDHRGFPSARPGGPRGRPSSGAALSSSQVSSEMLALRITPNAFGVHRDALRTRTWPLSHVLSRHPIFFTRPSVKTKKPPDYRRLFRF